MTDRLDLKDFQGEVERELSTLLPSVTTLNSLGSWPDPLTSVVVLEKRLSTVEQEIARIINWEYKRGTSISGKRKKQLDELLLVRKKLIRLLSSRVKELKLSDPNQRQQQWLRELIILDSSSNQWIQEQEAYLMKLNDITFEQRSEILISLKKNRRLEISKKKAKRLVSQKKLRDFLCPGLQTVTDDAFEIAKVITPILLGLAVAGTISIPAVPVLFASVALVISRMGIANLCGGYEKKDERKS